MKTLNTLEKIEFYIKHKDINSKEITELINAIKTLKYVRTLLKNYSLPFTQNTALIQQMTKELLSKLSISMTDSK